MIGVGDEAVCSVDGGGFFGRLRWLGDGLFVSPNHHLENEFRAWDGFAWLDLYENLSRELSGRKRGCS